MRIAVLANLKKNAPRWEGMPDDQWDDLEDMPEALKTFGRQVDAQGKPVGGRRDSRSVESLQQDFALYRALISQIDAMVGDIMKHVDLEKTLIVFTGDQGDYQGRRGRVGKTPWTRLRDAASCSYVSGSHASSSMR